MAAPLQCAELMTDGAVPVDRLEISRRRRHLDEIGARHIEGAIAADAEIGAGRADQRLGLRQDRDCSATGAGGGATSAGRSSHWSALKTVKCLRNGMASGSSPVSAARVRSR